MKKVFVTVWPELDKVDPSRIWLNKLKDEPIAKELLESEVTKYGNLRETWLITISDFDAIMLRFTYPTLEFEP